MPINTKRKIQPGFKQTDTTIYQLAFINSGLPAIITTGAGKIIIANNSACKLLGYSQREMQGKTLRVIFDRNSQFKKTLAQPAIQSQARALATVIKKNGKKIIAEISSAVFTGGGGEEKAVITIADRSQSINQQKSIDIQKEKIVAANIVLAKSKQKSIDVKNKQVVVDNIVLAKSKQMRIDVKNEKQVADNIMLAKSKQKSIDVKNKQVVADNIVLAKSKQKRIDVKNEKQVADNIMLAKSKQKRIDVKNKQVVADNIVLALAKSNDEKKDQKIASDAAYKEGFKLIFNSSSDVLYDIDLLTNEIILSDGYEKEFGYNISGNKESVEHWASHIHEDDKEAVINNYKATINTKKNEWKCNYRFVKADGSTANVLSSGIILRYTTGKAYRMIGYMQDVSKQTILEERLAEEIQLKESQIAIAMADAKETERSYLGKELHDNINQLLAASKMYLEMAKRGGPDSKQYLSQSSQYTLDAIEEIRKLTKGLTSGIISDLGLGAAIENTIVDIMEATTLTISCRMKSFKEKSVNNKFKHNLFRIIQEQLNNILKHARATSVSISLLQNKNSIQLTITDNGIGFNVRKKHDGIGLANIKGRAASYQGSVHFISKPGQGCSLIAMFPLSDSMTHQKVIHA